MSIPTDECCLQHIILVSCSFNFFLLRHSFWNTFSNLVATLNRSCKPPFFKSGQLFLKIVRVGFSMVGEPIGLWASSDIQAHWEKAWQPGSRLQTPSPNLAWEQGPSILLGTRPICLGWPYLEKITLDSIAPRNIRALKPHHNDKVAVPGVQFIFLLIFYKQRSFHDQIQLK